jgi:hypothetical protein
MVSGDWENRLQKDCPSVWIVLQFGSATQRALHCCRLMFLTSLRGETLPVSKQPGTAHSMVTVATGVVIEVVVDVCVLVIVNVANTGVGVTYVLCQRVSFMEI